MSPGTKAVRSILRSPDNRVTHDALGFCAKRKLTTFTRESRSQLRFSNLGAREAFLESRFREVSTYLQIATHSAGGINATGKPPQSCKINVFRPGATRSASREKLERDSSLRVSS